LASGQVFWTDAMGTSTPQIWTAREGSANSGSTHCSLPAVGNALSTVLSGNGSVLYYAAGASQIGSCNLGLSCACGMLTSVTGGGGVGDLDLRGNFLFWTDTARNAVVSYNLGNGAANDLAPTQSTPGYVATDDRYIYWSEETVPEVDFTISRTTQAFPAPTASTVFSASKAHISAQLNAMAADGTNVYFGIQDVIGGTGSTVLSVPVTGGSPTQLSRAGVIGQIIAVAGAIYWVDAGSRTIWGLRVP
jgi:hypothetical protein